MSKQDIYGKVDHGNAAEIASEALSSLSKCESNKVQGPVKGGKDVEYPEKD